ncbi:MAG: hypothetical protein E6K82_07040 [Candidatus Rokuibacteriota bacterium]|nr:MAG: hypothetical protein E6K82_07040 [Candidatus Rokubacteria bacterium]
MENDYGFGSQNGNKQRLLFVSVDVPAGSVNTTPCDTPGNDGVAQPYFVSVVNQGTDGPFPAATCLQANGSTTFDNNTPVDLFSSPTNAGFALTGAPLAVGTQFQFNITPNTGGPQTVVTTLDNPEAANPDPTGTPTDFINLMVPKAAPTSTGFTLLDAGITSATTSRPITISWTLPTFQIREAFVSPIVQPSAFGGGTFCSSQNGNLPDPTVTQATILFPTSCNGPIFPNGSASVCVFITGVNGERTSACWFFSNQGG